MEGIEKYIASTVEQVQVVSFNKSDSVGNKIGKFLNDKLRQKYQHASLATDMSVKFGLNKMN